MKRSPSVIMQKSAVMGPLLATHHLEMKKLPRGDDARHHDQDDVPQNVTMVRRACKAIALPLQSRRNGGNLARATNAFSKRRHAQRE